MSKIFINLCVDITTIEVVSTDFIIGNMKGILAIKSHSISE